MVCQINHTIFIETTLLNNNNINTTTREREMEREREVVEGGLVSKQEIEKNREGDRE